MKNTYSPQTKINTMETTVKTTIPPGRTIPSDGYLSNRLKEDTSLNWKRQARLRHYENEFGFLIKFDVPGDHPFELWYNGRRVAPFLSLLAAKIVANVMINDQIING